MNFRKIAERSFRNAVAVGVVGAFIPLPEELATIPVAIGLGVIGVDVWKTVGDIL